MQCSCVRGCFTPAWQAGFLLFLLLSAASARAAASTEFKSSLRSARPARRLTVDPNGMPSSSASPQPPSFSVANVVASILLTMVGVDYNAFISEPNLRNKFTKEYKDALASHFALVSYNISASRINIDFQPGSLGVMTSFGPFPQGVPRQQAQAAIGTALMDLDVVFDPEFRATYGITNILVGEQPVAAQEMPPPPPPPAPAAAPAPAGGPDSGSSGPSAGVIAAIVVVALLLLAAAGFGAVMYARRRLQRQSAGGKPQDGAGSGEQAPEPDAAPSSDSSDGTQPSSISSAPPEADRIAKIQEPEPAPEPAGVSATSTQGPEPAPGPQPDPSRATIPAGHEHAHEHEQEQEQWDNVDLAPNVSVLLVSPSGAQHAAEAEAELGNLLAAEPEPGPPPEAPPAAQGLAEASAVESPGGSFTLLAPPPGICPQPEPEAAALSPAGSFSRLAPPSLLPPAGSAPRLVEHASGPAVYGAPQEGWAVGMGRPAAARVSDTGTVGVRPNSGKPTAASSSTPGRGWQANQSASALGAPLEPVLVAAAAPRARMSDSGAAHSVWTTAAKGGKQRRGDGAPDADANNAMRSGGQRMRDSFTYDAAVEAAAEAAAAEKRRATPGGDYKDTCMELAAALPNAVLTERELAEQARIMARIGAGKAKAPAAPPPGAPRQRPEGDGGAAFARRSTFSGAFGAGGGGGGGSHLSSRLPSPRPSEPGGLGLSRQHHHHIAVDAGMLQQVPAPSSGGYRHGVVGAGGGGLWGPDGANASSPHASVDFTAGGSGDSRSMLGTACPSLGFTSTTATSYCGLPPSSCGRLSTPGTATTTAASMASAGSSGPRMLSRIFKTFGVLGPGGGNIAAAAGAAAQQQQQLQQAVAGLQRFSERHSTPGSFQTTGPASTPLSPSDSAVRLPGMGPEQLPRTPVWDGAVSKHASFSGATRPEGGGAAASGAARGGGGGAAGGGGGLMRAPAPSPAPPAMEAVQEMEVEEM